MCVCLYKLELAQHKGNSGEWLSMCFYATGQGNVDFGDCRVMRWQALVVVLESCSSHLRWAGSCDQGFS